MTHLRLTLLVLLFCCSKAYCQKSILSENFAFPTNGVESTEFNFMNEQLNGLIQYLVFEEYGSNLFLDNQPDIGRELFVTFLEDQLKTVKDATHGELKALEDIENLKKVFLEKYVRSEIERKSFERIYQWSQYPFIIASSEISQKELIWRSEKVIKQLKVLSEAYILQNIRRDSATTESVRSKAKLVIAEVESAWNGIVKDSLSFDIVLKELGSIENANHNELKEILTEISTHALSEKLAQKLSDYVSEHPYKAIASIINAQADEYAVYVNNNILKETDILLVQENWNTQYKGTKTKLENVRNSL